MPDVQAAADGGGRRVDGVELSRRFCVKAVDALPLPKLLHLFFDPREVIVFFHGFSLLVYMGKA
ncbi:hypothetical protein SDC9_189639 [bioreactor metagenome]|uniref:Uncharacterized protein n=1 Tax=bioreactor metagenome TaxID=1076179 RepID=A0A645I3M9_9ZZZZ